MPDNWTDGHAGDEAAPSEGFEGGNANTPRTRWRARP